MTKLIPAALLAAVTAGLTPFAARAQGDSLPLPPFIDGPPRPGYSTPPYPPVPPATAVWDAPQPPVPRGAWWHGAMVPYPHQRAVYYPTWDTPGHRPVGVWAPEVPQAAVPAFWQRRGQGLQSPP